MDEAEHSKLVKEIKKEYPVETIAKIISNQKASQWQVACLNSDSHANYTLELSGYTFTLRKRRKGYGFTPKFHFSVEFQMDNFPLIKYDSDEEIKKLEKTGQKIEEEIGRYHKQVWEEDKRKFKDGLSKLLPE